MYLVQFDNDFEKKNVWLRNGATQNWISEKYVE